MKKLLISILMIHPMLVFAQIPVTDAGLNAQMVQQSTMRAEANATIVSQLAESVEHTTQLTKTYNLMKEANEKLKKISGFIQKYSTITRILSSQKYQYNSIKNALERMGNSKYIMARELRVLQHCSSRFLKNTNEIINVANSVVTPSGSEMNDAERINILMKLSEKIDSEATAINYTIKNLEEIEKQRAAMANANNTIKRVFTGN